MPGESQTPFPTQRTTFPLRSLPAPAVVLQAFAGGSSAVPYRQSGPGSLVSPIFVTSLSPDCGFEVFTAPKPQRYWSSRPQRPPRSGTRNVGSVNPGFWRSEEHTSELQSHVNLVCRLLLEKKKKKKRR